MIAPPLPADESARLDAVRGLAILDTPAEERFDRVTRLAAKLFQTPIAYVAMVDSDRQWFKSKCGLTATQTGRDVSFCGHAILETDALVIEDASRDPRFHDNPLVTGEPGVRFYAGQPLAVGPDRQNVGTLCIVDRAPRTLTREQRESLRELADLVVRELELVDVIRLQSQVIESRETLARELAEAARYVASLLPPPLRGDVAIDWVFRPSSQLGGDAFGYHRLGDGRLAVYLLDVCGHGVGSALLSVSAVDAIRNESLPAVDFGSPRQVLGGLNRAFPMDRHAEKYFTAWYGVYDPASRVLAYASAGHPPAVLVSNETVVPLGQESFVVGMLDGAEYETASVAVPPGGQLMLFSDGAYEIELRDGSMQRLDSWVDYLRAEATPDAGFVERASRHASGVGRSEAFADDFSLVHVRFP